MLKVVEVLYSAKDSNNLPRPTSLVFVSEQLEHLVSIGISSPYVAIRIAIKM